jgi:broad specificity phosphatase PhoE
MAADLLVLARHARPEVDPDRPSATWTLGSEGREGARRLATEIGPLGVQLVVTSIEPKAVETGRVVAEDLDVQWQTGHDLHEHVRTSTGYLARDDFDASIRRFFAQPSSTTFGDESADAAASRFATAVNAVCRVHRGTRLCIVAHGTVMALHLERVYGLDGFATWKALDTPCYAVVDRRSRSLVELVRSV